MNTDEQIIARFRDRVRGRRDGFAAAQESAFREIRAERRRARFVLIAVPRPLRAAAALAVIGLGAFLLRQTMHRECNLPVCPHSTKSSAAISPYVAGAGADFLEHPERYDRICHCHPRYSGSLR